MKKIALFTLFILVAAGGVLSAYSIARNNSAQPQDKPEIANPAPAPVETGKPCLGDGACPCAGEGCGKECGKECKCGGKCDDGCGDGCKCGGESGDGCKCSGHGKSGCHDKGTGHGCGGKCGRGCCNR